MASLRRDVPNRNIVNTAPQVPPVGSASYWRRDAHEILVKDVYSAVVVTCHVLHKSIGFHSVGLAELFAIALAMAGQPNTRKKPPLVLSTSDVMVTSYVSVFLPAVQQQALEPLLGQYP